MRKRRWLLVAGGRRGVRNRAGGNDRGGARARHLSGMDVRRFRLRRRDARVPRPDGWRGLPPARPGTGGGRDPRRREAQAGSGGTRRGDPRRAPRRSRGRPGQPRQDRLPRLHEPRDPHSVELGDRVRRAPPAAGRPGTPGTVVRRAHPGRRRRSADHRQRHPGLQPGRGRRDRARPCTVLAARPHRRMHLFGAAGQRGQASRAPGESGRPPAARCVRRRRTSSTDPSEPAQQRHQVHRGRLGHPRYPPGPAPPATRIASSSRSSTRGSASRARTRRGCSSASPRSTPASAAPTAARGSASSSAVAWSN